MFDGGRLAEQARGAEQIKFSLSGAAVECLLMAVSVGFESQVWQLLLSQQISSAAVQNS
ncbi:hypothetical protein K5R88_08055 [Pseudomonas sp. MM213]|uniref:hypothetical protein n=1 Tax=Pseudomonas sp. MM213 TaxID=2866807 RepID=UPI001CF2797F|nr:hypothetical protein [Pseudomonas sp. MM213]UCP11568.1 hypothetical protein K5R88_08055 [Pseudomonas sp. MM213]